MGHAAQMASAVMVVLTMLTAPMLGHASPLTRLPRVVDANDRTVGGLTEFSGTRYVARKEQGAAVLLPVEVDRLGYGCKNVQFYHQQADCSDERLIGQSGDLISVALGGPACASNRPTRAYFGVGFSVREIFALDYPESTPSTCVVGGGTPTGDGYCCISMQVQSGGAQQSFELQSAPVRSFDIAPYYPPFSAD